MALPKILVVDDEEVMRDVLGSVLGGEGYSVQFAATGPDALAEFRESPVDAVILDLMLPGMSGLEVLDEMKRGSCLPMELTLARTVKYKRLQKWNVPPTVSRL